LEDFIFLKRFSKKRCKDTPFLFLTKEIGSSIHYNGISFSTLKQMVLRIGFYRNMVISTGIIIIAQTLTFGFTYFI